MTSSMPDVSFTDGLRRLADLLDQYPEVKVSDHREAIYCPTLEEFIAQVRALGPQKWRMNPPYYRLTADLGGGVSLDVFTNLKNVLTRPGENLPNDREVVMTALGTPIRADVLALTEAGR